MTQTPEDRPRPAPRSRPSPAPRPAAGARPSPRPRVAGSRREREEAAAAAASTAATSTTGRGTATAGAESTGRRSGSRRPAEGTGPTARRFPALAALLTALCVLAAAGVGYLIWQRLNPEHVDDGIFAAASSAVEDLYAYDYQDPDGSLDRKLAVLTGDLREQYEAELSQGGILDTYEQVSATTSYEVLDVGLQQVNDAQDTATVVVFGRYVAKSVTSGNGQAPEGSECEVTPEGAQSCVQTIRLGLVQVDGDWKISELTQLTTS
ncbi:hypothetical protein SAMN05660485_00573 [Blastococcus fimeti]|nr:hypothetical protein SAMN05660485_00573 [Blastococcus fimeti]